MTSGEAPGADMIEVGWIYTNWGPFLYDCWTFWEARVGGVADFHEENIVSCNTWVALKIYHVSGTKWKFFFDTNDDGTYEYEYPTNGLGHTATFSAGIPQGETARVGDSTSAYDHHDDLKYRSSAGAWWYWTCQALWANFDTIDGYHWDLVVNSEYEVHTGPAHGNSC